MIRNKQYIRLQVLLDRILRHPLLQGCTLESVVQHVIDFITIFGIPQIFEDKEVVVEIKNFRGKLPCDLISINQVKDLKSGICLRSMTDTFNPNHKQDVRYGSGGLRFAEEMTFKTQNTIIFTSFEHGDIVISYKAIPVDEEGFPLLIDDALYLKTLELYVKKEMFTILFDCGKITPQVLANTQSEYSWKAGQLQSAFLIPSESEMESLKNSWCTLLQRTTDFDNGWRQLGNREYIKNQER